MNFQLDPDTILDLTCTQCGHQFSVTVRELESQENGGFLCPNCGVQYLFEGPSIEQTMQENLEDFRRDLGLS